MARKGKATHYGECQVCGRNQKLPNGKLSIHGYTVDWNCFMGTCPGSHNLPWELSCDMAKKSLAWNATKIAEIKAVIDDQENNPDAQLWFGIWRSATSRSRPGYYEFLKVDLEIVYDESLTGRDRELDRKYPDIILRDSRTGDEVKGHRMHSINRREDLIKWYVDHKNRRLRELEKYDAWLTERIGSWEIRPLTPVEKEAA